MDCSILGQLIVGDGKISNIPIQASFEGQL